MKIRTFFLLFILSVSVFAAQPFRWSWKMENGTLSVTLQTAPGAYVYQKSTELAFDGSAPVISPKAQEHDDEIMGRTAIFEGKHTWRFAPSKVTDGILKVSWQGCHETNCFLPESVSRQISPGSSGTLYPPDESASAGSAGLFPGVKIERTAFGYRNAEEFAAFLEGRDPGFTGFAGKGTALVLLLTLLGGLALNFTPCVLPMIPINLAIIGADTGDRRKALARGFVYAAGIAAAYGCLGVAAVLGGATFGTLSALWYFNFGAALVFLFLGLSMFGVFTIDFSRFGGGIRTPSTARLAGVFLLGGLSALLAGACVAPVVIAVLLHAANRYAAGYPVALLLPFLLGIGMGLPWPFAAAGLARLPKPGMWMVRVKQAFGVLIVLIGLYYGWLGLRLLLPERSASSAPSPALTASLTSAFRESARNGKPVLIDFRADWCKNCKAMELGPLRNSRVRSLLRNFNLVELDVTRVSAPEVKAVMTRFGVSGLPAFVIAKQ
ncbi:MAG: cytochrome c biogenesis protein CcdA [Victivallales bacterium]|nr:cytochrome c biogenesis protein CcdA [bacterium]MDY5697544.1 cytochrome c biogenesis protein CcdA [Victivallales bacterium]